MYNDYDDMFDENDLDDSIDRKKELIEEAKTLQDQENMRDALRLANDLKRKWKQVPYMESAYEDTLRDEFEGYIDVIYAKQKASHQGAKEVKEALIKEANSIIKTADKNWKEATAQINDLMQQWKSTGSAGRDEDDALWEAFNAARTTFFENKNKYWEDLQNKFENAKKVKEELITQAAELANSDAYRETGDKLKALMDQWKAVGSAGKQHEDTLWEAFNAHRQTFFDRRKDYYDGVQAQQENNYEEKSKLLAKAKEIAATEEYIKENTEKMKILNVQWKEIGSCGREKEDAIWEEFRATVDGYFNDMKDYFNQKQLNFRQKLVDTRTHKMDLIQNQKRQIQRMKEEIVGLLGERAIQEMEEDIIDCEAFIKELEEEVAQLDKRLES